MSLFRRLSDAVGKIGRGRPAEGAPLNAFRPGQTNAGQLGFVTTGLASHFTEACERLNVRPAGETQFGYGRRSAGAEVSDASGNRLWLKVFGLTSADNERWKAEQASDALIGVRKPELMQEVSWTHQGEIWVARLSQAAAGVLEDGPWADDHAHGVSDGWIADLNQALEALAKQRCRRAHIQPDLFKRWLRRHFRRELPDDFVASHNDLQWSNLASPELLILDWEWFGLSPRGYDQGMLIAYSCGDEDLTARLEQSFALILANETAHYGKLFAAHTVRNSIKNGWLNPALREPLTRLIKRWESERR